MDRDGCPKKLYAVKEQFKPEVFHVYQKYRKGDTFLKVKGANNKDQECVQLREALLQEGLPELDTDFRFKLPEGLEKHNRVVVPRCSGRSSLRAYMTATMGLGVCFPGPRTQCFGRRYKLTWRQLGPGAGGALQCLHPSQARLPLPDCCTINAKIWLLLADRLTRWVSVFYFPRDAKVKQLITILREMFYTFDVAESILTDDGSQCKANEMGGKTAKRLLVTRNKSDGSPDWDNVSQTLLQHRITPIRDLNPSWRSFSLVVLSGVLLPVRPGQYTPAETLINCGVQRELALRHKVSLGGERW